MELIAVVIPVVAVIILAVGMAVSSRKAMRHVRSERRDDLLRAKASLDANTDYDAAEVPMVRTSLDAF